MKLALTKISPHLLEHLLKGELGNIAWTTAPHDLRVVGMRIEGSTGQVRCIELLLQSDTFEELGVGDRPPHVTFYYGKDPLDGGPVARA